jgi:hypothetical protein
MKLSALESEADIGKTPSSATLMATPAMPEGIQAIRRTLSVVEPPVEPMVHSGPSTLLQLPQYYWNHLQAGANPGPLTPAWDALLNFAASPEIERSLLGNWQAPSTGDSTLAPDLPVDNSMDWINAGPEHGPGGNFFAPTSPIDQAEISSALMRYMLEAARGQ